MKNRWWWTGKAFPSCTRSLRGIGLTAPLLGRCSTPQREGRAKKRGVTVVVDQGMADRDDLELIKSRGYHYVVAARQSERDRWLGEFEEEEGFIEGSRLSSATNPCQKKTRMEVKKKGCDGQVYVLVISEERKAKGHKRERGETASPRPGETKKTHRPGAGWSGKIRSDWPDKRALSPGSQVL